MIQTIEELNSELKNSSQKSAIDPQAKIIQLLQQIEENTRVK